MDDACHDIFLLDAARVFWTQGVKANVVRTTRARASAFRSVWAFAYYTHSVKANFFPTQRINANVIQTMYATASAFRSVRVFAY